MSFDNGGTRVDPSLRHLPRVKDVLKRAAESRNYRLRSNQYHSDLENAQKMSELAAEKVYTSARLKQETLDLQIELLRRVEDEKDVYKKDVAQLETMERKLAHYKKQCFLEIMAKNNSRKTNHNHFQFNIDPSKDGDPATDEYWFRPVKVEPRSTNIKVDYGLIYPNAKKPGLYRKMFKTLYVKEISRINEKSLHRLKEKYCLEEQHGAKENMVSPLSVPVENDRRNETSSRQSPQFLTQLGFLSTPEDSTGEWLTKPSKRMESHETSQRNSDVQNTLLQRGKNHILKEIEDSRKVLEHWNNAVAPSKQTMEKLDHCHVAVKKKKKVKQKRQFTVAKSIQNPDRSNSSKAFVLAESRADGRNELESAMNEDSSTSMLSSQELTPKATKASSTGHPLKLNRRKLHPGVKNRPSLALPHIELSPIISREPTMPVESTLQPTINSSDKETHRTESNTLPSTQSISTTRRKSSTSNESARGTPSSMRSRRQSLSTRKLSLESSDSDPNSKQRDDGVDPKEWKEVLRCRYLRGYEPPEMLLPDDESLTDFVFDRRTSKASLSSVLTLVS